MRKRFLVIIFLSFFWISNVDAENNNVTLFEAVGRYAFATAGSNNAYRGDSSSTVADTMRWVKAPPTESWYDDVVNNLISDGVISSKDEITNISGSYLDTNSGVIEDVFFGYYAFGKTDTENLTFNGKILLINPDHSYKFLPISGTARTQIFSIKDYVNIENPDGWYYVAFLKDELLKPQTVWGITAIYQKENVDINYLKLIHAKYSLSNGASSDIMFDSKFKLSDKFQLTGMILAAGANAWSTTDDVTGDTVYALLSDNSTKQLYETTYNGKTIFKGRTATDFANQTFGTKRNHDIAGGELDIFDETLSSDFFDNKEIIGYRFTKTGSNGYFPALIGLSQKVSVPNLNIETKINTKNTNFKSGDDVNIVVNVTNKKDNNGVCSVSYNNIITSTVDNSLSDIKNIKVIINDKVSEIKASYDSNKHLITTDEIETINCDDKIVISYDAKINDNISNNLEDGKYVLITKANIEYSLVSLSDLTGEELEKYLSYRLNLSATDKVNCDVIVNPQTGFEYKFVFVLIGVFVLSVYFIISNQKKLNINK